MSFSLTNYLVNQNNNNVYYEKGFMRMIESCLGTLRTQGVRPLEVSNVQAYKYEGDFYGLLLSLGVSYDYLWITLRVNGMLNTTEYTLDRCPAPITPSQSLIEELYRYYTTTTK